MNLHAVIERVWKYTWRPQSSDWGDPLGGRDLAGLEIHLQAGMERDWTVLGGGRWMVRRELRLHLSVS